MMVYGVDARVAALPTIDDYHRCAGGRIFLGTKAASVQRLDTENPKENGRYVGTFQDLRLGSARECDVFLARVSSEFGEGVRTGLPLRESGWPGASEMRMSRSGSRYCSGFSSTARMTVNMTAFPPLASASVRTAVAAKAGL
jgi:hypothetical protein